MAGTTPVTHEFGGMMSPHPPRGPRQAARCLALQWLAVTLGAADSVGWVLLGAAKADLPLAQ
jgi:hypothetical protein